jgi:hypothetical protein
MKSDATLNPGQVNHLTKGQILHLATCDHCEELHDRAVAYVSGKTQEQLAEAQKQAKARGVKIVSNKELSQKARKGEVSFSGDYNGNEGDD